MSGKTNISWSDYSWNPVTGCVKVSAGCDNCYAEAVTLRYKTGGPFVPGNEPTLHPDRLDQPTRWKKSRMIFVNSMSDLFWGKIPTSFLTEIWNVMLANPRHTFQILTKRPKPALRLIEELGLEMADHIWIGVSVENQPWADVRIPQLLAIPAPVRFLSVEPMLGPVNVSRWLDPVERCGPCRDYFEISECHESDSPYAHINCPTISWVITGGESGLNRRPFNVDWVRAIRDQCAEADVAFFHKQHGGLYPGGEALIDGKVHHQWPGNMAKPVRGAQGVLKL